MLLFKGEKRQERLMNIYYYTDELFPRIFSPLFPLSNAATINWIRIDGGHEFSWREKTTELRRRSFQSIVLEKNSYE